MIKNSNVVWTKSGDAKTHACSPRFKSGVLACSIAQAPMLTALLSLASVQHHTSCSCGQNQGVPPTLSVTRFQRNETLLRTRKYRPHFLREIQRNYTTFWTKTNLSVWTVKWLRLRVFWIRISWAVRSVWIYWRIQWLFPVDTVTVWAVLRATGIRMIILVSTAVPSAERPSPRGLFWIKTPCWLKWWRNWRRQDSRLLLLLSVTLNLETWRVMSALGERAKLSSPAWCVWPLTVKLTSSLTMNLLPLRSTNWSKPLETWRRRSALIMTSCWRFTVVLISSVSVICVRWMNTEAMIQSQLQQKGLRNR